MPDENAVTDSASGAASTDRSDPYRAYNFRIELDNSVEGYFVECSGLAIRVHSIPYREGGTAQLTRRLPGPVEYGEITLRFGLTSSKKLWDWFQSGVSGKVERRNISIVVLDSDGVQEVMRWNVFDAWVSEWHAPAFNTLGKDVAIGFVTIVSERIMVD